MATKKTNSKAPAKEQKRNTPNISARIDRLVDYENSKVKAIASVNIGGAFAIHGLRVIDSQKGLFVQMPQNSFQKDGKTEYSDIYLLDRANKDGECWPAIPTIARELKLSQSTVRRALQDLRKAGLLETEQRYRKHGGKSSLLYSLKR